MKNDVLLVFLIILPLGLLAENPIIKHVRTADPSAHVWYDSVIWVYTSHDMDTATTYDSMDGYRAFSSHDMVHWTDHGEVLHSRAIPWGVEGLMWAPSVVFKHNRYYMFYPHSADGTRDMCCGVAVSAVPEGPFEDAGWIEGVSGRWLDPCIFMDVDSAVYLYWGVYTPKVARLSDDLLALAETPRTIDYGADNFFEASYMHYYNGHYYFSYNSGKGGYYAMGTSPYGPFQYQGAVNPAQSQDHHAMVEFKSQWYFFYHVQDWNGGSKVRRNTCVEYMYYNEDGTIQAVYPTHKGVQSCLP